MNNTPILNIEVAYATPDRQQIITLTVSPQSTVIEAIIQSKIQEQFIELKNITFDHTTPIGIFGKKIDMATYQLQNHDRIEIYRPLIKTPNQRRLERAKTNAK